MSLSKEIAQQFIKDVKDFEDLENPENLNIDEFNKMLDDATIKAVKSVLAHIDKICKWDKDHYAKGGNIYNGVKEGISIYKSFCNELEKHFGRPILNKEKFPEFLKNARPILYNVYTDMEFYASLLRE